MVIDRDNIKTILLLLIIGIGIGYTSDSLCIGQYDADYPDHPKLACCTGEGRYGYCQTSE